MRIVVIEEDPHLSEGICTQLSKEGFHAEPHRHIRSALPSIALTSTHAAMLSLTIPGEDGLGTIRGIRAGGNNLPILLLSGRTDAHACVNGLNAGADDCVTKPFLMMELIARLRALLRRASLAGLSHMRVGDLVLDPATRRARRGSRQIDLTQREYQLLEFLMRSGGEVCPRNTIIERVWNYQFDPGTNIVDVYIRKLRGKLEASGEGKLLHSVKGVGYVMRA